MPTSRRAFTDEENNDEAIPCAIVEGKAGSAGPIPHPLCVNFCCMHWSIPSNKTVTLISSEVALGHEDHLMLSTGAPLYYAEEKKVKKQIWECISINSVFSGSVLEIKPGRL